MIEWKLETEEHVLPSSVTKLDIVGLLNGSKWDEADKWIENFERKQKDDAKLRK